MRSHAARALAALIATAAFAACSSQSTSASTKTAQPVPRPAPSQPLPIGGMWLPEQIPPMATALEEHGVAIDTARFGDPKAAPLAAIVAIPGCSASFVSRQGLIITNHHCVQGTLARHSTEGSDLVRDGFLARSLAEEKSAGPTGRVYVTDEVIDVTNRVRAGLADIADARARYAELERRSKELEGECEKARPNHRCSLEGFFGGGQYRLFAALEIRDLRLVYAPAGGIGYFGGDTDNWMWPRHTGDFSFLRAYVGKDGAPADYSPDNVPYQPAHVLAVSEAGLREGEMAISVGYPGSTQRNRSLAAVREAVEWRYPRAIQRYEQSLELLRGLQSRGGKTAVVARHAIFAFENRLKNTRGMLEQLANGGLLDAKQADDKRLRAWIAEAPAQRARYQRALAEIERSYQLFRDKRAMAALLLELADADLLAAATTIVHMAHERAKDDRERKPAYQERNWPRLRGWLESLDKSYDRAVDVGMLGLALDRLAAEKESVGRLRAEVSRLLTTFDVRGKPASSWQLADILYQQTRLMDSSTRLELFDRATVDSLAKSRDPLIRLALVLYPLDKELEAAREMRDGELLLTRPDYVEALRELRGGRLAPDANRTLRVTFGRVRGYRPSKDAEPYRPFTTLRGVVAKHTGEEPFDAPDALLAAAKSAGERYKDDTLADVPVAFLTEIDLTGGSSGSATLNGKGELVGLAFDTNLEAMGSDWQFQPELSRAIHVDIRYILWIMAEVDHATRLLEEMGMTASQEHRQ